MVPAALSLLFRCRWVSSPYPRSIRRGFLMWWVRAIINVVVVFLSKGWVRGTCREDRCAVLEAIIPGVASRPCDCRPRTRPSCFHFPRASSVVARQRTADAVVGTQVPVPLRSLRLLICSSPTARRRSRCRFPSLIPRRSFRQMGPAPCQRQPLLFLINRVLSNEAVVRDPSNGALSGRSSNGAPSLGEGETNDGAGAASGMRQGGSVSNRVIPPALLKEFNVSRDILPVSPVSLPFPVPFFFLVMTQGNRNTTHTRVLAGQSGGITSFMKHGIPCCWLVVKLGTPQDRRLDRSHERQKGDCERTKGKGEGEMSTLFPSFLTPH